MMIYSARSSTPCLFERETNIHIKVDRPFPHQQSFDETELLGFSLGSPFDLLDHEVKSRGILATEMVYNVGEHVQMLGDYVIRKPVTTATGRHMCFATFWDRQSNFFDTIHFPPVLSRFPITGKGLYLLSGRVITDFGFPSLEVSHLKRLAVSERVDQTLDELSS